VINENYVNGNMTLSMNWNLLSAYMKGTNWCVAVRTCHMPLLTAAASPRTLISALAGSHRYARRYRAGIFNAMTPWSGSYGSYTADGAWTVGPMVWATAQ
jgi:hypothetical protein